jgi:hypothetical protein
MIDCPNTARVQAFLDDDLPAAEADAFRDHVADCEACASELAGLTRLIAMIERAPAWDPGVAFTERVLDRVVPSRVRRRLVTVVGWAYTSVTAVSTFALASWFARPDTPRWITERLSELYLRSVQSLVLVLHTLVEGWLSLGTGWSSVATIGEKLAPLSRVVAITLSQPLVGGSVAGALAVSVLMLWWMRPRARGIARTARGKEITHVDLLGF